MDQSPISRGPAIFYVIYFTCDYFGIGRVSSRDCQQRLQDESSVIAAPARTLSILSPTEEFLIMWTTLALLSALSVTPGQNDLSLTHVRPTLGLLGPTRSTKTISPGDILYLSFDIEGISVDEQGMVRYSTALEVSDASGKMLFKRAGKIRSQDVPGRQPCCGLCPIQRRAGYAARRVWLQDHRKRPRLRKRKEPHALRQGGRQGFRPSEDRRERGSRRRVSGRRLRLRSRTLGAFQRRRFRAAATPGNPMSRSSFECWMNAANRSTTNR